MASPHIRATPPSKDAMLNSFLESVRYCNACLPPGHNKLVFATCQLKAEMPLLLNPPGAPLACTQVHAFFNVLHDRENMANKPSSDDLELLRPDEWLKPLIYIDNQSLDKHLDRSHRVYHTRRLTVQNSDSLPLLNRVIQLRILDEEAYGPDPANMRPVSMRTPLELATRLPHLRELDCPWLWEYLPIAFTSRAMRRIFPHLGRSVARCPL